jgi:hypothetical protein
VTLAADDFLQVVLTKAGGDLTTTLVGPGGAPLGATTTSNDGDPAPLSAVAVDPGDYRVEVRLGPGFPRAAFRLSLQGPRPASPEDRQRVSADGALAEGEREARREKPALEAARERYEEALRGHRALGAAPDEAATWSRLEAQDPGVTSRALFHLARAEHATGALDDARAHLEESLGITEPIRGALAGADVRASFLATAQARYGLLVDVLMALDVRSPGQGFVARAFTVSDRARARGLLELLAEARADIREGIPPELLTEAQAVEAALDARAQALAQAPPDARAAVAQALEALTARHRDLQAEIRARSPRYAALTQPADLDPEALGRDQLDADTVLLEYAPGEERSFLWVISSAGISAHALPPRAAIEAAVRRVHARWSMPGGAGPGPDAPAAALARMILGPAAGELRARRWLVVADGALLYLPFAALPAWGAAGWLTITRC